MEIADFFFLPWQTHDYLNDKLLQRAPSISERSRRVRSLQQQQKKKPFMVYRHVELSCERVLVRYVECPAPVVGCIKRRTASGNGATTSWMKRAKRAKLPSLPCGWDEATHPIPTYVQCLKPSLSCLHSGMFVLSLSTESPICVYVLSDGKGAAGEACWRHQATSALLPSTRAACIQGCSHVPTIQMAFPLQGRAPSARVSSRVRALLGQAGRTLWNKTIRWRKAQEK